MMRCPRCFGRKQVYKVNAGYSLENTGGVVVKCPFCQGEGKVKPLSEVCEDIKVKVKDEVMEFKGSKKDANEKKSNGKKTDSKKK
jgi:hypothetical protein